MHEAATGGLLGAAGTLAGTTTVDPAALAAVEAELRWSSLYAERLPGGPWLLLCRVEDGAIARFLEDADLRSRVSLWDCTDQTKVAAARTSLGVHFEWFLRDDYKVKVRPAPTFTGGLLVRGTISLGM